MTLNDTLVRIRKNAVVGYFYFVPLQHFPRQCLKTVPVTVMSSILLLFFNLPFHKKWKQLCACKKLSVNDLIGTTTFFPASSSSLFIHSKIQLTHVKQLFKCVCTEKKNFTYISITLSNTAVHKLYFSMEFCYTIVFLSSSMQMAVSYKKLDYNCFIPHTHQLSVHYHTTL